MEIKERPILFSGPMVRAILDGRKTQTRRILKKQPQSHHWEILPGYEFFSKLLETTKGLACRFSHCLNGREDEPLWVNCPYGKVGDRLWVRENYRLYLRGRGDSPGFDRVITYPVNITRGDCTLVPSDWFDWFDSKEKSKRSFSLRPSIHMPRFASRILLEITDIRVERLQDINEEDAQKEGVYKLWCDTGWNRYGVDAGDILLNNKTARGCFRMLWEWIHDEKSWDSNPFVWVVSFKPINLGVDK